MFKLYVCASILIAVVGGYDFRDSDINKWLINDLTSEVDKDLLNSQRFKRNTDNEAEPYEQIEDTRCCSDGTENLQEWQAIKEVKDNCIAEIYGDTATYDLLNRVQPKRKQLICVGYCIAMEFDLLEENGDLKRDKMLEHSRKMIGQNKWKAEVLEEYVDKCLDELKASKEVNDDPETAVCNPRPLQFHQCIWEKFIQQCPAELQIDSENCRKIREQLARDDNTSIDKYS